MNSIEHKKRIESMLKGVSEDLKFASPGEAAIIGMLGVVSAQLDYQVELNEHLVALLDSVVVGGSVMASKVS